MKPRFYINKFVIIANLMLWFSYLIVYFPYLSNNAAGLTFPITSLVFNCVVIALLFLGCFYYLNPYFLRQEAYGSWILALLGVLVFVVVTRNLLDKVAYTGVYLNGQHYRPIGLRISNTFIGMVLIAVFSFLENSEARKQEILKQENLRLAAELGFLQSQINPHFLFNTLNNIYSFAYRKDDRAPAMITKLSEIIRYLLYECRTKRISLQKEMALIENYLELESMRHNSMQNIDFFAEGIEAHHQIAPLILITFVENCFKHGDIHYNSKAWMKLHFEVDAGQFHAEFVNSRMENNQTKGTKEAKSSGIGIENAKMQLALNYPNQHELTIESTPLSYTVKLNCRLGNDG